MNVIEAEGLVKRYREVEAVAGVDFQVESGELFGFLGPNGAGKTTTINILCTLAKPAAGRATVAGYDVVKQRTQVRQRIGLVFQDPSLDEYLTARENLEFHAMCYNMPMGEARQRIGDLLAMVGLWDRRSDLVRTFSGGMKRRLELVRGLLHRPQVLFLDEPTLGLDPQARANMWGHIRELRESTQSAIFMTTHYMEEAEQCDRVAIMDRGRIVALDKPARLKAQLGGDVITLHTRDNPAAAQILSERYGLVAHLRQDGLEFRVERGDEFIPKLVRELGDKVMSVGLRRPTLEDVFLQLTGHALRDEQPESRDQVRVRARDRSGTRV